MDKSLEKMGGERVFPIGEGDDDANLEEDFVSWDESFWPDVCEVCVIRKSFFLSFLSFFFFLFLFFWGGWCCGEVDLRCFYLFSIHSWCCLSYFDKP